MVWKPFGSLPGEDKSDDYEDDDKNRTSIIKLLISSCIPN